MLPWNWRAAMKALFRRLSKNGVLFSRHDISMASMLPEKKADKIIELMVPKTVIDIGCGTGRTMVHFQHRGIDVRGIEASRVAIKNSEIPHLIYRRDLRKPIDLGRFDLAWCFEVAEHIHPQFVEVFVDNLVRAADVIAISAAPPGQGGEGHFNEQPQDYWVRKFQRRGYSLQKDWTHIMQSVNEFYSENMMVFIKAR
jgi:SAM-dependent methyltransferase